MTHDTKSSRELEHEIEQDRAGVRATLSELRQRMTPGQMLDEAMSYAKDGSGGDFVRNLGRNVRDNPMPVALVGLGLAWLMSGRGRPHVHAPSLSRPALGSQGRSQGDARERAHEGELTPAEQQEAWENAELAQPELPLVKDRPRDSEFGHRRRVTAASFYSGELDSDPDYGAAYMPEDFYEDPPRPPNLSNGGRGSDSSSGSSMMRRTRQAGSAVAGMAADMADGARGAASSGMHTAGDLGEQAAHVAYGGSQSAYHSAAYAMERLGGIVRSQPLLLGALGLIIGAAVGAGMPATQSEDRLMGKASARARRRASDALDEGYDRFEDAAQSTFEEVRSEAQAQGLTRQGVEDAAADLGERVRKVADTAKTSVEERIGGTGH